jgi:hypothetical protein
MAAICLVVAGAVSLRVWRIVTLDGIAHINATHAKAAQWLVQHESAVDRVAALDIGRISFALKNPVTDLGGLVDPAFEPYLTSGRVPLYLSQQHIHLAVLPQDSISNQLGFTNLQLEQAKVAEFCSPPDSWRIAMMYTSSAARCQSVYRFPGEDSSTSVAAGIR